MKHLGSTLWLVSALVLLCGCGGGGGPKGGAGGIGPLEPSFSGVGVNIGGNWTFSTTSTVSAPPLTIAGSINQSGSSVSGAVHISGSNCFDQLTTMGLTGKLTGKNISLTSNSVAGQVTTFTGSITESAFTGTYTIKGGCADGDQGNITGVKIFTIGNTLSGTFTASGGKPFEMTADMAQSSNPSPEGSFAITGTATFRRSCINSGTITPGTFPSASFIMGTSVALEIKTDNGTVAFLGTFNRDKSEIDGAYTVSGGSCDQTGIAVLVVSSPWDY